MALPHFVPTFMVSDESCMYSRVRHTLYSCLQYKCSPIHWPTPLRKEGQVALDGVCHLWYCGYPNSSPKGISTTTKAIMHCLGLFPHLCVCTCTPDLYDQKWVPKKRTRDYQRLLSRNPERNVDDFSEFRWRQEAYEADQADFPGLLTLSAASAAILTAPLALATFSPYTLAPAFLHPPSRMPTHLFLLVYITANQSNDHNRKKTIIIISIWWTPY